jgi:hypothetical protein
METTKAKRNVLLPAAVDHDASKYNSTEDAASGSDEQQQQPLLPERKRARTQDPIRARILLVEDGYCNHEQGGGGVELTDAQIEQRLAFCCFKCTCSDARRGRIPWNDKYIQASDDSLWHRRCCHDLVDSPWEDWLPPADQALLDAEPSDADYHLLGQETSDEKQFDMKLLIQKYRTAKTDESEMYNEDEMEGTCVAVLMIEHVSHFIVLHISNLCVSATDPASQLNSNTPYTVNRKWFNYELAKVAIRGRRSACVLVRKKLYL